ncbi:hypothetical protein D3C85_1736040 [compost metagenome]
MKGGHLQSFAVQDDIGFALLQSDLDLVHTRPFAAHVIGNLLVHRFDHFFMASSAESEESMTMSLRLNTTQSTEKKPRSSTRTRDSSKSSASS